MAPRRPLLALFACALALAGASACSKDGDAGKGKAPPKGSSTSSTAEAAPASAPLNITGVDANGTKPPGDDVVAKVKSVLERYMADAMVAPLKSGQPAGDLTPIFTPDALARVGPGGPERASLVDEGLPAPASTSVTFEKADAALYSVAGADEVTAILAARIDFKARARGPQLDVDVVRQGDLILVPAADGGWQIDAFAVRVSRDSRPAAS